MTDIKDLIPQLPTTLPEELKFLSSTTKGSLIQGFNRAKTGRSDDEFMGCKLDQGRFLLHYTFLLPNPTIYEFLKTKSKKVGPNSGDNKSNTPFHFAALAGK